MGLNVQMSIKRNVLLLRLDGDLDQYSCSKLKLKVTDIMKKYNIRFLIINFEKVEFMDSTGIGFMIGRYHELKNVGGKILICSINNTVKRIISLSGLQKICNIVDNEEKAYKMLEVA